MTPTYDADVYEDGNQFKDDAKLVVMFWMNAVKNDTKSIEAGRPIFEDQEYITIIVPGQRDTLVTEVTDQYRRRFAKQYENWKLRQDNTVSGTPLAELPWMSVSQVAEFGALHVKTVEQLVNLNDNVAQKFMGYHDLKRRAQRFLDAAAGEAPGLVLEAKLAERDLQIAELQRQMSAIIEGQKAKSDVVVSDKQVSGKLVPPSQVK